MSNAFRFRDYQSSCIAGIFRLFRVEPAGPDDDPIVAEFKRVSEQAKIDEQRRERTEPECPF